MILDKIENLGLYENVNSNFSKALEFVKNNDLEKIEEGRYEVDGNDVFVLIQNYVTKPETEAKWEAHKNYIDIQCIIKGNEIISWSEVDKLSVKEKYSEAKDIAFYNETEGYTNAVLHEGYFAVFFPQDAHRPGCIYKSAEKVKKMVIKLRVK